ncbi:MAG: RNA methyltransferase [Clostridiales bacterium]|nr:RNA methyltransferase [Clostridiales bacterium]
MDAISSTKNPFAQSLRSLKDRRGRDEQRAFLVEGPKLVAEALDAGLAPLRAAYDEGALPRLSPLVEALRSRGADVRPARSHVIDAISDTLTPQGLCAAFSPPAPLDLASPPPLLVALDGVRDPGNVGAIWRVADAAGFHGLLLSADCADRHSPKVQRASMGSGLRLPAEVCQSLPGTLKDLAERGFAVISAVLGGGDVYARPQLAPPLVLVIGSEARGVSDEANAQSRYRLSLPMRGGAESLNAAVAAGVLMYELTRGWPDAAFCAHAKN